MHANMAPPSAPQANFKIKYCIIWRQHRGRYIYIHTCFVDMYSFINNCQGQNLYSDLKVTVGMTNVSEFKYRNPPFHIP